MHAMAAWQPPSVTSVRHAGGHRLELHFADGTHGVVDLAALVPFRGVLAPLREPDYVARARVAPRSGTVVFPNGADLDEVVLYAAVRGLEPEQVADFGRACRARPAPRRTARRTSTRGAASARRRR
jgi:hypothetical protein